MSAAARSASPPPVPVPFAPRHLLLPLDFSDCAERALPRALALAEHADAELHLLHVVEASLAEDAEAMEWQRERLHTRLDRVRIALRYELGGTRQLSVHTAVTTSADPAAGVLRYADRHGIDLVVMGTHGDVEAETPFGSVARGVRENAGCPVITVPSSLHTPGMVRRVLLPAVPHQQSRAALRFADAVAALMHASLVVSASPEAPGRPACARTGPCCTNCKQVTHAGAAPDMAFAATVRGWTERMPLRSANVTVVPTPDPLAFALDTAHGVGTDLVVLPGFLAVAPDRLAQTGVLAWPS